MKMFKYAQDYDLITRISHKHNLHNIPEYLLQYRVHGKAISNDMYYQQMFYTKLVLEKNLSSLGITNLKKNDFDLLKSFFARMRKLDNLFNSTISRGVRRNGRQDRVESV